MKTFIVPIFLSFIVFVFGWDADMCNELDKISINCGGKPKACERIKEGKYDEVITNKCAGKCILEAMGILNGEKFDLSMWSKAHEETCEKSRLKEIDIITQKCTGPEGPGPDEWAKDKCGAVQKVVNCMSRNLRAKKISRCL